jgi:predicted enzyme related to lactoylglutathione lyase
MADKLLGSFVWCELLTSDTAAAESFYKKVVGWTATPFGPDGSYTVFNNSLNSGVGGAMRIPDGAKQPPCWLMYVGTPNVDETAMRIAQLGGRVLKQPDDIPTVGRFAVVQDPFGATFAIFTPKPAPGSPEPKRGGPGDFSWFELYTPNPDGAWRFYETLFGWQKTSAMDMGEMGVYQMFGRGDGIPNGGIMKPPPGAPPAWMPYAMVKDAKASAATAAANGGKIINGPMEVPGGDWIAQGIDPQGAVFAVHSLNPASAKATAGKPATSQQATPVKETVKKVLKAAAGVAATVIGGTAVRRAAKKLKSKSSKKAKPAKKKVAKKKPAARKPAPKKSAKKSAKKAAKKTGKKKAAKRKK